MSNKGRYNSIPLAIEYFHGTNIVLAHFHNLHNGSSPLHLDTKSKRVRNIEGLLEGEITFLSAVRDSINARAQEMQELRRAHCYEEDLYWSHQLFSQDWVPEDRHIVDDL